MELLEVMGGRRSIRFVRPYQPGEKGKIQMMLEAARVASHWDKCLAFSPGRREQASSLSLRERARVRG